VTAPILTAEQLAERSLAGVYFVQAVDDPDGLIKIGYTQNVGGRLRDHQISSPVILGALGVLVDAHPGAERRLHARFRDQRVRGEWFRPTDRIRRLAAGEEPFLAALVTHPDAARMLSITQKKAGELLASRVVSGTGNRGIARSCYWEEDLAAIARQVEEERIRRATREALKLLRKRLRESEDDLIGSCLAAVLADGGRAE
jgi:hypothetical protein